MSTVYIERFKGSPLSIEISIFKQMHAHGSTNRDPDSNSEAIVNTLGNLGLQFTNITAAPL